jgi:type IV pilus assembly protein PilM
MKLFAGETKFFGLDIGTTGIRAVQLKKGGPKPTLVTYADVPLPAGLTASDAPQDEAKVAEAIKALVKTAKIDTNQVVASIPSSQAFATLITTPKLSQQELAKAIQLQADQYIPMAVDQVKIDWQIIGPGKTPDELQVLLISAPNSIIEKRLKVIEAAGLELVAMEVNAVALTRSLMPRQTTSAALILDLASNSTDIAVVHSNAPKLLRSISVGSNTFYRAAEQSLGLDAAQAQQFVQKFGLTQNKLEGQVLRALKPSLDLLMGEIDKSIKFFMAQNEGVKLEKIIATGGASALPEFPMYLANSTGLPVEIGNPWAGVSYPADWQERLMSLGLHYAVAVGLALR